MAQFIGPGTGSAAIVLTGGVGTQPFITTIGVDLTLVGGNYIGAANTVFAAYQQTFLESTSNELTLERVILSVGQDNGDAPTVESTLEPVAGDASGDFLPLSCALLLNKRTQRLGREGRGRMFIPGVLKDNMVDISGTVGETTREAFNQVAEDFLGLLNLGIPTVATSVPPILLHSDPATQVDAILTLIVGPICGTMARRIK